LNPPVQVHQVCGLSTTAAVSRIKLVHLLEGAHDVAGLAANLAARSPMRSRRLRGLKKKAGNGFDEAEANEKSGRTQNPGEGCALSRDGAPAAAAKPVCAPLEQARMKLGKGARCSVRGNKSNRNGTRVRNGG
jgi:hypothetical protein